MQHAIQFNIKKKKKKLSVPEGEFSVYAQQ